jgi:WD40 repeat protein
MFDRHEIIILLKITLVTLFLSLLLTSCGGGSTTNNTTSPPVQDDSNADDLTDADLDGLTKAQELILGTDPNNPDSDNDRIWDGEEVNMYATLPTVADTDADGMLDGADPQPTTVNNNIPTMEYAIFTDNASGSNRVQLIATKYEQNHLVYAPTSTGAPFIIYQTYLADGGFDGNTFDNKFDEGDLPNSAIAIMNIDGSRPRLLTDLDATGKALNNNAIDATPEPSPDGKNIIFVSDRDDPGSAKIKLYVMDIDGKNPVALSYAENAPDVANGEIDADPDWGINNTITFKRETLTPPHFSRVYTATIDTTTMTLNDVILRTDENDDSLSPAKGDYDPKISPDGTLITSYRRLAATPGIFGDYDIWVGRFNDLAQPQTSSLAFVDVDPETAHLFPRWNQAGNKLALWSLDANNSTDPIDIVVFELNIQRSPFAVSVTTKKNITLNGGWIETMPSWNTDPAKADSLIYSASR